MTTDKSKGHLALQIVQALYEVVQEAGEQGAPAGPMYMAAQTYGMSLEQFETIMGILVSAGKVRKSNHCYFVVNAPVAA